MIKRGILILISFLALSSAAAQGTTSDHPTESACPFIKIEPERLADLNIPRFGNAIFCVNGEMTVTGGHTSGFIPTATAEYYKDGKWHLLQMVYPHDTGCSVLLKSGKVLLAGGYEKNLGIGQTHAVEMYDPQSHTFDGFGCMELKRTQFTGLELDSGHVVLSGNWYHDDAIELFDGEASFTFVKDVSTQRNFPHIFQIAKDDAIFFSSTDIKGNTLDTIIIDRLKGEPFTHPLFDVWKPLFIPLNQRSDDSFIGNKEAGQYAYLFPVKDKDGQVAIAKCEGMDFSLLPTDYPVPMFFQEGRILYHSQVLTDKKAHRGYMLGTDDRLSETNRHYILCIDYNQSPATLTLYYTDPTAEMHNTTPMLTPDGNLMLAGGKIQLNASGNFRPSSAVFLFRFGSEAETERSGLPTWSMIILLLAGFIAVSCIIYLFVYKKRHPVIEEQTSESASASRELFQRICRLMDEERLYLNSELKVSDISQRLGTNKRYVSDCIKLHKGCAFSYFVNTYRIEYAKQLLRQNPEKKMTTISWESGFANDTTFFRTFKAFTNMTPKEWLSQND